MSESGLVIVVQPALQVVEVREASSTLQVAQAQPLAVVQVPGPQGPRGFTGPAGNGKPEEPEFFYVNGLLSSVVYADGSSKAFTYDSGRLVEVLEHDSAGAALIKTLTYNPDGSLAAVTRSTP